MMSCLRFGRRVWIDSIKKRTKKYAPHYFCCAATTSFDTTCPKRCGYSVRLTVPTAGSALTAEEHPRWIGRGINIDPLQIEKGLSDRPPAEPFIYTWCRRPDLNRHGRGPLPPQDSVSTKFHHFGTLTVWPVIVCHLSVRQRVLRPGFVPCRRRFAQPLAGHLS